MYSRVNYTIVGIFVLLFGIGTVAFSFWLAKYGLHQEYDLYKTYMRESVSGLSKDSVVRLHGVDVGRVKQIRIDPDNIEQVEVLLNIKHGVPIKADMVAHTAMLGVTGLLSIEIDGGSNGAKTLQPTSSNVPLIRSVPSWFDETKKSIGTLSKKFSKLVERTELLFSERNIQRVGAILEHTEELTGKSVGLIDEANATLVTYHQAAEKITHDLDDITQHFDRISEESVPTIRNIKEASQRFSHLTQNVEKDLKRGDFSIKKTFEPLMVNMEILSDQINALARELRESPSDIMFKSRQQRRGPGE